MLSYLRWMRNFKRLHIASLLGVEEKWRDYINDDNISRLTAAKFVWLIDQDKPYSMRNIIDAWHVAIVTYKFQPWYARAWLWLEEFVKDWNES